LSAGPGGEAGASRGRARFSFLPEDARECPATWALAASWVVVFVLMHLVQARHPGTIPQGSLAGPMPISTITSHRFGDMTWAEVRSGQSWRLVTATFIHFSLIHLGLNALMLVKLGRLIEPWYGPGPFLAICLAIGGLGNLAGGWLRLGVGSIQARAASSALARQWPGLLDRLTHGGASGLVTVHTGGGSTILLGLLGLSAVVGWRSRTRIGLYLRDQMVALLGFTAVLGILLPNLIDNYGHAGGALVGAGFGFAHRRLFRAAERPWFGRMAWGSAVGLMLACLVAGVRLDRAGSELGRRFETASDRYRDDARALQDLERLFVLYGRAVARSVDHLDPASELDALAMADLLGRGPALGLPPQGGVPDPGQVARDRAELAEVLDRLDRAGHRPWGDAVAADLDRLRSLGRAALVEGPRYDQVYEFVVCWRSAVPAIVADRRSAEARLLDVDRRARGLK